MVCWSSVLRYIFGQSFVHIILLQVLSCFMQCQSKISILLTAASCIGVLHSNVPKYLPNFHFQNSCSMWKGWSCMLLLVVPFHLLISCMIMYIHLLNSFDQKEIVMSFILVYKQLFNVNFVCFEVKDQCLGTSMFYVCFHLQILFSLTTVNFVGNLIMNNCIQ